VLLTWSRFPWQHQLIDLSPSLFFFISVYSVICLSFYGKRAPQADLWDLPLLLLVLILTLLQPPLAILLSPAMILFHSLTKMSKRWERGLSSTICMRLSTYISSSHCREMSGLVDRFIGPSSGESSIIHSLSIHASTEAWHTCFYILPAAEVILWNY